MIKGLFSHMPAIVQCEISVPFGQGDWESLKSGRVTQKKFGKQMGGNQVNSIQIIQGVLRLKMSGVCALKTWYSGVVHGPQASASCWSKISGHNQSY